MIEIEINNSLDKVKSIDLLAYLRDNNSIDNISDLIDDITTTQEGKLSLFFNNLGKITYGFVSQKYNYENL